MKAQLILLSSLFLMTLSTAYSQGEIVKNINSDETPKFLKENILAPSFKGGDQAFAKYLNANLTYPERARRQGIEGTVVLEYYIKTDGSLENTLVVKSVSPELDQEAIRLVNKMPNWNPATINGQPERICYHLPITFKIN